MENESKINAETYKIKFIENQQCSSDIKISELDLDRLFNIQKDWSNFKK